ncbi:MAG: S24 family peptidase [Thermodesulfobacteriota bacterium]
MRKSVEEIIDTIKSLKGFTNDYEVAETLGIARAALSGAKKRDSISFLDELVTFCGRENLTLDFIRRGTPVPGEGITRVPAPAGIPPGYEERYVEVPVMSYAGSAHGAPEPVEVDTVVVPRGVYGEGSVVIRVSGDSMEKLLMDGSKAVVDTGTKEIISGCIYAFVMPWEGSVVRECVSEPSGLSLIPCNRNYPASSIKWDEFDPAIVIGKVSCSVMNVFG